MKTFLNLQDEVLQSMGDEDDQSTLRDIVKAQLDLTHRKILTEEQWDFMLWPKTETIAVIANKKNYNLHPEFFQPLYFWDTTEKQFLEVVPVKQTIETMEDVQEGDSAYPPQIHLNVVSNLAGQPDAANVVEVETVGGTESAANSVIVRGIHAADGLVREELLSSTTAWSTLASSTTYSHILDIIKVGTTWSRQINVICNGVDIVNLRFEEYGKHYHQMEFMLNPLSSNTINYRFYRRPKRLVYDGHITDIPEQFQDLLIRKVQLQLTGYSRPVQSELDYWKQDCDDLMKQMRQTYQQARALNSRARYVTYIAR